MWPKSLNLPSPPARLRQNDSRRGVAAGPDDTDPKYDTYACVAAVPTTATVSVLSSPDPLELVPGDTSEQAALIAGFIVAGLQVYKECTCLIHQSASNGGSLGSTRVSHIILCSRSLQYGFRSVTVATGPLIVIATRL